MIALTVERKQQIVEEEPGHLARSHEEYPPDVPTVADLFGGSADDGVGD